MSKAENNLPVSSDYGTPERAKRDGGISIRAVNRKNDGSIIQTGGKAKRSCKLDWYWDKGTIDNQMYHAGAKFALLYFLSGKVPRTTVMLKERVQTSMTPSDYERLLNSYSDAEQSLNDALDVLDPDEKDVIREVAGLDNYAGRPGRTLKLKHALRALAVHWKIPYDVKVFL
jgi:hypothetical protein